MQKPVQQGITLSTSLLQDASMQPLRVILPSYKGITHVPTDLTAGGDKTPELMVFIELNKCFQKAGFVAMGRLGDLIWGFEQVGYDPIHVASGLTKLRHLGYLAYVDSANNPVSELFHDPKAPVWVSYTDKFLSVLSQIDGAPVPQGGVAK